MNRRTGMFTYLVIALLSATYLLWEAVVNDRGLLIALHGFLVLYAIVLLFFLLRERSPDASQTRARS